MRIQTFSIVAGTRACNARCPFCVSKMTGFGELPKSRRINVRNFNKAAMLAERAGTTTVLITGKGEPTLYPQELSDYLALLRDHSFPLIELQTNALDIGRLARDGKAPSQLDAVHLAEWYSLGLDTIAVSVVDVEAEPNRAVYHEDYPDLSDTIAYIAGLGFSVRLCVMMQHGYVDSPERLRDVIDFCRAREVEQLTVRPIRRPEATESENASTYVQERGLGIGPIEAINRWVDDNGTHLMSLMHGAKVYDVGGQNVCVSDCLTIEPTADNIRTLIFYSDGRVTYDWQHDGAILLGGGEPERG